MLRSRREATESLRLPKINAKMPARTQNAEMSKIVTNSEIHCITASVNPGALKLEKPTTGGVQ